MDPFDVLGIANDATEGEAKRNFRLLAKQFHPDRNPGDRGAEAKFKEVHAAWEAVRDILPKSAVPFPDVDPDDPAFEDAIAEWMMAMYAAAPQADARPTHAKANEKDIWRTVASEQAGQTGPPREQALVDNRSPIVRRSKRPLGIEKINAQQAEQLIKGRPNAFAALKIVQRVFPELCLYDAVLARAHLATSTALTIIGADAVDDQACAAALRTPLASVETAANNIDALAPYVKLEGKPMNPRKLAFDVAFLREAIEELAEKIARA